MKRGKTKTVIAEDDRVEVVVYLPAEVLAEIDEIATDLELSRSEVILNKFDMLNTFLTRY